MALKESCKEYDKENTGIISLETFKHITKEISIEFPQRLYKYMLLLFYSNEMKLNQVPYRHFIKAYGAEEGDDDDDEENELDDEEKAKVVRHYLGVIGQILSQNKKSVVEVFECDDNGMISADEFAVGLRRMGLEEIEHEHIMMMLEALQCEEVGDDICISIEELDEILSHYGVPSYRENEENEEQDSSLENSPDYYKKISLLDSGNNEIQDKTNSKDDSNIIKENSSFNKNKSFEVSGSEENEEYEDDYDFQ